MCSLLLIPAPGPWCRLLLFLQRQRQGFAKEPHSEHCMVLLEHGLPDPGSLEAKAPRAPQEQWARCHPAALTGCCSAVRQLPSTATGGSLCAVV